MIWDFAEANPFAGAGGDISGTAHSPDAEVLDNFYSEIPGICRAAGCRVRQSLSAAKVVSTDPPYYDNIGYADLSDFFYVWLRRSLQARLSRPLRHARRAQGRGAGRHARIATAARRKAEAFFLDGMTQAMHRLAEQAHPAFPVTIYYAFKQSESDERRRARPAPAGRPSSTR